MIRRYNSKLEIRYILLEKELEKCKRELAELTMEAIANPEVVDITEIYYLDDFVLEVNMYNKEDVYEEDNNQKEMKKCMIVRIIEELGYDSKQFEEQIIDNDYDLFVNGHMWKPKDDIVLNILCNAFPDDIYGACEIIDMLEEKFGYNDYLHYAIVLRDRHGSNRDGSRKF